MLWSNERSIGGNDMSASKDKERGTWKIYLRYVNWQEMKQIHTKHGFAEWDPQL